MFSKTIMEQYDEIKTKTILEIESESTVVG